MKVLHIRSWLPFIFLCCISACQKDYKPGSCRITEITGSAYADINTPKATIEYNNWGAPVRVIKNFPGTGNTHYLFTYDENHRLSGYVKYYDTPEGHFDSKSSFVYDGNNLIIGEVTYINRPDFPPFISTYEYDSKHRVIRVSVAHPIVNPVPVVYTYSYDRNGNLIHPGTNYVYDNKINFHRTNPVWMFMDRDYSVNNPIHAKRYNAQRLPTSFGVSSTDVGPGFLDMTAVDIKYDCSAKFYKE